VLKRRRLASLNELTESGAPTIEPESQGDSPEDSCASAQIHQRRAKLIMRLFNRLNDRERAVFKCLSQPSEAFLMYMRNIGAEEATHAVVAGFLGVSKNTVDFAALGVRTKFTRLAECEFADLIEVHLERGTWPMIHISRADQPDHEFVARIIRERKLDPRPTDPARDIEVAGDWAREVHNYPWGCVLIVKNGSMYRTMVIEGRFNRLSGGVSGADGTWKNVTDEVPWYPGLVRELSK